MFYVRLNFGHLRGGPFTTSTFTTIDRYTSTSHPPPLHHGLSDNSTLTVDRRDSESEERSIYPYHSRWNGETVVFVC